MMNFRGWLGLAIASSLSFGMATCSNSTPIVTPIGDATGAAPTESTPPNATAPNAPSANEASANTASANIPSTPIRFNVEDGAAIEGTDPVAYFTQGAAVQGNQEFAYEWNGAVWHFASAENRDLFIASPEQYAPQYGGYCAWAVSQGYVAPIDPDAWKIVDGKLYLNFDRRVQARWERDIPQHIAQANENWPDVLNQ